MHGTEKTATIIFVRFKGRQETNHIYRANNLVSGWKEVVHLIIMRAERQGRIHMSNWNKVNSPHNHVLQNVTAPHTHLQMKRCEY